MPDQAKTIGVIDYGAGNFSSVVNAMRHLDLPFTPVAVPADLEAVSHVVLPGVGAFGHTMAKLRDAGFVDELRRQLIDLRKPFLGICVGMQVLATVGTEHGAVAGLDLIEGSVDRIPDPDGTLRIPHVGWTEVHCPRVSPLFHQIEPGGSFYFVHSYALSARDPADVVATCDYGGRLTVAIERRNIFGVQFHPEKSQNNGLRLLRNFFDHVAWGAGGR